MKIKKIIIAGLIGFICLQSGYILINMFLKVLVENGWYGFFSLVIFMISLVWSINYWYSLRQKVEIVKDVADELTTEKIKSEPDFFHNTSPDQYRNQLKENLLKKVEKENYVFFGKKA